MPYQPFSKSDRLGKVSKYLYSGPVPYKILKNCIKNKSVKS